MALQYSSPIVQMEPHCMRTNTVPGRVTVWSPLYGDPHVNRYIPVKRLTSASSGIGSVKTYHVVVDGDGGVLGRHPRDV